MLILSGSRVRPGAGLRVTLARVRGAPPSGWTPGYSVPSAGQATLIGTNTAGDVRPSGFDVAQWQSPIFTAYGGGTMVNAYGQAGAYVVAGSGGHNAPTNCGACLFDFEDATWKRVAASGGFSDRTSDLAPGEVSGNAIITGTSPGIPAPTHTYSHLVEDDGNVVITCRPVILTSASGSNTSYKFNLTTGAWSAFGTNMPGDVASRNHIDGASHRDPTTNRIYLIPNGVANWQNLLYYDAADNTWKATTTYAWPGGTNTVVSGLHDALRVLWFMDTNNAMWGLDLNNIGNGWQSLTRSGTPTINNGVGAWHPTRGAWYFRTANQGTSISKLTPPASNPFSNAWAWSTETIGGSTIPAFADTDGDPSHYSALQYVPSIGCLAWFASASASVCLIQPAS